MAVTEQERALVFRAKTIIVLSYFAQFSTTEPLPEEYAAFGEFGTLAKVLVDREVFTVPGLKRISKTFSPGEAAEFIIDSAFDSIPSSHRPTLYEVMDLLKKRN